MRYLAFVFAFLVLSPAVCHAVSLHAARIVVFKNGTATVHGRIRGYECVDYRFAAGGGESLKAELQSNNSANYFNLLAPGETEVAFFNGGMGDNVYSGKASTSGDYTARVYLMRSAARRGAKADYKLTIALGQTSAANDLAPDFADGLTGGPDYWGVTTKKLNEVVALRQAPSVNASILLEARQGAILRNLGCKNAFGQRWCKVETMDGSPVSGWVLGANLHEVAAQPIR